jgi:hypothetical protein
MEQNVFEHFVNHYLNHALTHFENKPVIINFINSTFEQLSYASVLTIVKKKKIAKVIWFNILELFEKIDTRFFKII